MAVLRLILTPQLEQLSNRSDIKNLRCLIAIFNVTILEPDTAEINSEHNERLFATTVKYMAVIKDLPGRKCRHVPSQKDM